MVLFAKRVSAYLPPASRTSTSSAVANFRTFSKICCALSLVSIETLRSFVSRTNLHIPKPRRRRSVSRAHRLHGLSFAAVRSPPQSPLVARADSVHRVPELCRDAGIRWILQHASQLAAFDLPSDLATKLEVVTLVVDGPRPVRLHVQTIFGVRDELLEAERFFSRQDRDIRHADDRQPAPTFRAHRSAGTRESDHRSGI